MLFKNGRAILARNRVAPSSLSRFFLASEFSLSPRILFLWFLAFLLSLGSAVRAKNFRPAPEPFLSTAPSPVVSAVCDAGAARSFSTGEKILLDKVTARYILSAVMEYAPRFCEAPDCRTRYTPVDPQQKFCTPQCGTRVRVARCRARKKLSLPPPSGPGGGLHIAYDGAGLSITDGSSGPAIRYRTPKKPPVRIEPPQPPPKEAFQPPLFELCEVA